MKGVSNYAKFAWGVLFYNVAVILWGAYVRATGSGAGCGSHWPTCNGEVIPRAPQIETLVEYTHRLSSGLSFILVVALFVWAWRLYNKGHRVRLGASLSMLFIITEALVGAGLVLFRNITVVIIALHLINTFMLLASLGLTAWWASGGRDLRLKDQGIALWALGLGFLGVLLLGVTGALTAQGDTLFPSESLAAGIQQDFSPTAHILIRLRVFHPLIAIAVGFYLIFVSILLGSLRGDPSIKRFSIGLSIIFVIQLAAGLVNLVLLAPVWMQLVHLFLADAIWITLVLLAANTFAQGAPGLQSADASQPQMVADSRGVS